MYFEAFSKWLSNSRAVLLIICVGILLYFNSFSNGFIADDFPQIVDNATVHSLANIPDLFTESTFYTGGLQLSGNYYRPIEIATYTILYALFNANPTGYHIFQVFLHIANAILVFYLFTLFLKKEAAFLFSLIFLSHPINNESIVYIANLQDVLFVFFGLLAIIINRTNNISSHNVLNKPLIKPFLVGLFLLLSLLSKETGIVFLFTLIISTILFDKKSWVRDSIVSACVLIIYAVLRFVLAGIYFNKLTTAPIMSINLWERLINIPNIIFYYLKTFIFPYHLIIFQTSYITSINVSTFYLPLLFDLLLFMLLLYLGWFIYKKDIKYFKVYLLFFSWFLVGLIVHMQIIPIDATVADRFFYFPIIGLLGISAIALNILLIFFQKKLDIKETILLVFCAILLVFSVRVIDRNANWKDQMTLLSHDIQYNQNSYQLQEGYGLELMKIGNLQDAYPHLLKATQIFPTVNNLTSLGVYYGNTKQFGKAKTSFGRAMQYDDLSLTYEDYALLLLLTKDYQNTKKFSTIGVTKFPNSYKLWLYLAISSYNLNDYNTALNAANESNKLNPRPSSEYTLTTIKNHQILDMAKI